MKARIVVLPGATRPDVADHIDRRRFIVTVVRDARDAIAALQRGYPSLALVTDERTNGLSSLRQWVLDNRERCYCILIIAKDTGVYPKRAHPRVKKLRSAAAHLINTILDTAYGEEIRDRALDNPPL